MPVWPLLARRRQQLSKAIRLLPNRDFRRGLRIGVAATIEHERIIRGLPVDTLVDVGANRGQFSLLVRAIYPHAVIYAFEPLERPAAAYRRLFAGDPLTTLHQCAVGPQHLRQAMHVSARDDSSSLLPITAEQVRFAPGTAQARTETVAVERLDQYLSTSNLKGSSLLKIDVQGFELEALKGCETLLPCFDFIYVEVSFLELYAGQALAPDIMAYLIAQGFQWCGANTPSFNAEGHCVQIDLLFRRVAAYSGQVLTQPRSAAGE